MKVQCHKKVIFELMCRNPDLHEMLNRRLQHKLYNSIYYRFVTPMKFGAEMVWKLWTEELYET